MGIHIDDQLHRDACLGLAMGVDALRLNRHFPSRDMVAAYLEALANEPGVSWDPRQGMPDGTAWLALDVARQEAERAREGWHALEQQQLGTTLSAQAEHRRARRQRLVELEPLPIRSIDVQLRHRGAKHASYQVVVDRFDIETTTLARYTLVLDDVPGAHVSEGELALEAREHFADALALLDAQDAALAFAVLGEHVQAVHEVVRGVIGPMYVAHPSLGAQALADSGAALVASACLERASVDVETGRIDDPLAASVVLPSQAQFGLSRTRKFATQASDVSRVRQWVRDNGSRALTYGWR